jgi:FkbH-like protein
MYETEVNDTVATSHEIPREILTRFSESRAAVAARTVIPWSEHCTECVWPTCYTTCDLYQPRMDGRCRRFVEGMVRIDHASCLSGYLLKITFRRWAKLWAVANLQTRPLPAADRAEREDQTLGAWIRAVPHARLRRFASLKRYSMKKRSMHRPEQTLRPHYLLVECYNPNENSVVMTVAVRRDGNPMQFQAALAMTPGFNRHRIPVGEIERMVDLSEHFFIELTPNDIPEGLTLYFGGLDFVVDRSFAGEASRLRPDTARQQLCKCLVWDLDNTLWDGVLVEDGASRLRLKPGVRELLKSLDERGILLSIASKNNREEAIAALRGFGLEEYFLYPQISWNPKSEALRKIASSLNIGLDSLRFVDDSAFEREEVASGCPEVTVIDATEYLRIPERPDFQAAVTAESRTRRLMYRDQEQREEAQRDFGGDYLAFLRDCGIRLTVRPMSEENLERVHELTQRTNQMNFSGNRYSRAQIAGFLRMDDMDTYVLDCADRFGSYGTVGFCLVDRAESRMRDLMFSCRIQGKRVEHSFVSYLILRYRQAGSREFRADYRRTSRNAGPGKVFDDLGFVNSGEHDGITSLLFPTAAEIRDDGIVAIDDRKCAKIPALSRVQR